MGVTGQISDGTNEYMLASTCYGTCATGASTVAKVANIYESDGTTLQSFTLMTGITIHIKFTNSNTASSPTLNINGTGAKNIYKYGTTSVGTTAATSWNAGSVVSFTYDGSAWQMNDHIDDTNSSVVTGVKGNEESSYRTGNINITCGNIGALSTSGGVISGSIISNTNEVGFRCNSTDGTYGIDLHIGSGGVNRGIWDYYHSRWLLYANTTTAYIQGVGIADSAVTIANGDALVIADSSDNNELKQTSIRFDGSTTTKALSQKGTWETFSTNGYSDWAYISPSNVTNISGSAGNQRYLATITVPAHTLRLYDIAVDLTKGADGGQADLVISSTKGATTATGSTPSGADTAFQYTAKTIAPCPATGNFLIKLSTQIRNNTASSKTYQLNLRRYLGGTGSLTAVTRYSQIEYPA